MYKVNMSNNRKRKESDECDWESAFSLQEVKLVLTLVSLKTEGSSIEPRPWTWIFTKGKLQNKQCGRSTIRPDGWCNRHGK